MSMPFANREFIFTQPDGTKLKVYGTGNQHQATFTTSSGFTVVRNPASGYFEYARRDVTQHPAPSGIVADAMNPLSAGIQPRLKPPAPNQISAYVSPGLPRSPSRWQVRRDQHRLRMLADAVNGATPAPPQRQTVGTFVGLCLLVEFDDEQAVIPQSGVDNFCNQQGYRGFGNNGSVRDYFFDVSDGKLTYTNIVAPWFKASKPRTYYTDESVQYPMRARELILEALAHHMNNGFDFSRLSADDQKFIYAINVFYAGTRVNNWSQGLWPHSFHLQAPIQLAPGKFANDYQITDMSSELTLGTFCHENGHMICDFPDLYDYGNESRGVGSYCLMCAGANVDPKNPTQVGAYLKHAAGWSSKVTPLAAGGSCQLPAGKNEFGLFRRNRTQYFILENRERSGRDASLPSVGLAIWKVDEAGNNSNEAMTPASHYECSLIQADGSADLEMGVNDGDPGDLYGEGGVFSSTTRPNSNWWDGTASDLTIRSISAPGPTITFSV
ncbi:secreted metalloprotease [Bradyrhizobium oligotrophicum S58]|uniref:Secreted metalloprotease n=1 Tax=Bradyrhizobium oligotrophicum S58 TaxID=1245469 RepID=M4Z903_9BRAD|nr:M6 family metalloprotease domain-containing protein [Bradyrhizobium oligotrophicum]BAM89746.1 secreted metalloprotease [Bradyrhizobium oligotrophicum S58]